MGGRCGIRGRLAAIAAVALLAAATAGCGDGSTPGPATQSASGDAMGQLGPVPSATPGAACLTGPERAGVVRLRSGNGASLAGVVLGTGPVGVVFAHGNNTDLCDWMPYARVLAAQGYQALVIDLNGFGASQASAGVPVDPRYDQDLTAGVRLLRSRGDTSVFLVGEVIGGIAAVRAATEVTVAGVVDVSSPARALRIDGVAAARKLRQPLLCIASRTDEFLSGTREVAAAAPHHRLLVVDASAGETALFTLPEVRDAVGGFLRHPG
jgi:hypothetical protein